VGHSQDDAERVYLGGEVMLLRREKSTDKIADGVILPIGLLFLQATTQLLIAGVYMNDVAPVSPGESEDGGG